MDSYLDKSGLQYYTDRITEKFKTIFSLKGDVGQGALSATKVSKMTDKTKIYVYTGHETGYTFGDWYYYDGSSWVSGGQYSAEVINTDKTLSLIDQAADSLASGQRFDFDEEIISMLNHEVNGITELHYSMISESGKSIKWSTGEVVDDSEDELTCTDFVEIPGGSDLIMYYTRLRIPSGTSLSGMAFYDSDYQYISGVSNIVNSSSYGAVLYKTEVPINARYARFTYPTSRNIYSCPPFYVSVNNDYNKSMDYRIKNLERVVTEIIQSVSRLS